MFFKKMRWQGEFKIFLRDPKNGKILFRSFVSCSKIENLLWKWDVGVCLDRECMEFVMVGWLKVKFYDVMIWSWSGEWEILIEIISKSCFWWFGSYWRWLKLWKLVTKDWVHISPGFVSGGGRVGGRWNCMYLSSRLFLGGSNAEKWGDHQNNKFFITNSLRSIKV